MLSTGQGRVENARAKAGESMPAEHMIAWLEILFPFFFSLDKDFSGKPLQGFYLQYLSIMGSLNTVEVKARYRLQFKTTSRQ